MTSSVYPGALDNDANLGRVDSLTAIGPADHNNLVDSIEAIEATLGENPQGASATVAARFGALGGGGSSVAYSEVVLGAEVGLVASVWTDIVALVLVAGTYVLDADVAMVSGAAESAASVRLVSGAGVVLCQRGLGEQPIGAAGAVHLRRRIVSAGETVKVQGNVGNGAMTAKIADGIFGGTTGTILTALKVA